MSVSESALGPQGEAKLEEGRIVRGKQANADLTLEIASLFERREGSGNTLKHSRNSLRPPPF